MAVSSSSPYRASPWSSRVNLSLFGVIPTKGVNKWRLIVDLSSPHDTGVNDGIDSAFTSIHYLSIGDAVGIIQVYTCSLVVELWKPVERDELAVLAFPLCVAVHGCLWYMGLWGTVVSTLVPSAVAPAMDPLW